MEVSIIIPLYNEEESLRELHDWITEVMKGYHFVYQIIFVDDGSTDGSWRVIKELSQENGRVQGIRFLQNYGKSQALNAGFQKARGEVVITMDADLQDSPEEIPDLFNMITKEGYDLVSGWKKKRYDSVLMKNLPSKLFNWAARRTSGLKLHDFNCGLKAYRKEVVKNIDVYGEMHRYIPVLAKNAGYKNITEKVVQHQARKYGQTKFGMSRFINGFLDLVTISFLSRFGKRPMHFFGALGVLMFFIGFAFAAYLGIDKLFIHPHHRLIANRPEFFLALITMVIGTQFFIAGFLGEMILRTKVKEKRYKIVETF
ncbi:Glycosyltransferase involved in cell wall bisynthesis [Capnocytophaga haemolytica]|jgi:glycosyltransferase, family 2|uniref:Glycosyl transferase family 2 n=1 Tax=Capnocytophaga haemolytica TaxID=45243 RepID=A0AAX2GW45_9FLAO|nr:glycosyltransferase family 2 protein [Capnocytophaga haemolytica]AMD85283.1 glycosyl transferase family 2 [Capnocytophaga haemolytica]SFN62162.1 Glycosyltransferase involved in cell wall bisynthesis [Capnocytophaga haemolytica]SNV03662.1 Undecaprenyl-phosphate 4-deoxy-4-formamido-L-arabinose transferase [Capnocytophaga haemolytica]